MHIIFQVFTHFIKPLKALDSSLSLFRIRLQDPNGECDLYPLMFTCTPTQFGTHLIYEVSWSFSLTHVP